jgi:hypothetical protein
VEAKDGLGQERASLVSPGSGGNIPIFLLFQESCSIQSCIINLQGFLLVDISVLSRDTPIY